MEDQSVRRGTAHSQILVPMLYFSNEIRGWRGSGLLMPPCHPLKACKCCRMSAYMGERYETGLDRPNIGAGTLSGSQFRLTRNPRTNIENLNEIKGGTQEAFPMPPCAFPPPLTACAS